MAKKLLEKAGLINLPAAPRTALPDNAGDADAAKAKTAPGSMLQFMTAQSAAVKEAEALRERLAGFDGALPVRRLDPATVRVSAWANRHADSFQDAAYLALKADIAAAGGNVQPIKVRPVAAAPVVAGRAGEGVGRSNPPAADGNQATPVRFEIVYGHRRHRACLELGLPVAAIVEELSDAQLFAEMDRENRERANLAPWEQGAMYKRALDAGLFPSLRKLASALGVQAGNASTAVQLASLPDAVVAAFESPLVLQYRWAAQLQAALERDRAGVLARAAELSAMPARLPGRQVLQRLVGDAAAAAAKRSKTRAFTAEGRQVGTFEKDASGAITVRLASGALDAARERKLTDFLSRLLAG